MTLGARLRHRRDRAKDGQDPRRIGSRACRITRSPYTSTIVFLVRKGNPEEHQGLGRSRQAGVQVITPNPKTSGGARWNYPRCLGLRAEAIERQTTRKPRPSSPTLYRNVPVLDSGARGSTTTFVQRGQGDVLLAWENEAFLAVKDLGPDKFEIVVPSYSVLAQPPVTLVDGNVDKDGSRKMSEAYLHYLYSPDGQNLIAHHYYRPSEAQYADPADLKRFPKIALFKVADVFGPWDEVQKKYFADKGVFDQIYGESH